MQVLRVLVVIASASLALIACSSKSPALPVEPGDQFTEQRTITATVATSIREEYFDVFGETTEQLQESLHANGPRDGDALGMVQALPAVRRVGPCADKAFEVSLDLVVVLPAEQANAGRGLVDPALAVRWGVLTQAVRAHEQRHVDIWLEMAEQARQSIEAIDHDLPCDVVDEEVRVAFERLKGTAARLHDAFHLEEDRRLARRIARIEEEIARLEGEIQPILHRLELLADEEEGIDRQLRALRATYPSGYFPEPDYSRAMNLTQRLDLIAAERVALEANARPTIAMLDDLREQRFWVSNSTFPPPLVDSLWPEGQSAAPPVTAPATPQPAPTPRVVGIPTPTPGILLPIPSSPTPVATSPAPAPTVALPTRTPAPIPAPLGSPPAMLLITLAGSQTGNLCGQQCTVVQIEVKAFDASGNRVRNEPGYHVLVGAATFCCGITGVSSTNAMGQLDRSGTGRVTLNFLHPVGIQDQVVDVTASLSGVLSSSLRVTLPAR